MACALFLHPLILTFSLRQKGRLIFLHVMSQRVLDYRKAYIYKQM